MDEHEPRPTGLTRDSGWQIGARRGLPLAAAATWELLTGPEGRRCWLGDAPELEIAPGGAATLADGTRLTISVCVPPARMRLSWHPPGWPRPSIMQLRVIAAGERSVAAFHQEHLPDAAARAERRDHFSAALDALEQLVETRQRGR